MKLDVKQMELLQARKCLKDVDIYKGSGLSSRTFYEAKLGLNVTPATIGRIAKAMNVDPAELIKEEV
jgi:hypothetical protein